MSKPVKRRFFASAPPYLVAVRELRESLRAALAEEQLPDGLLDDLLLAMSEIATNVVKHASPPASEIAVELAAGEGEWLLEVFSDGGSFDEFTAHMAASGEPSRDGLAEDGLGLHLIACLFPDHGYDPAGTAPGSRNRFWLSHTTPTRAKSLVYVVDDDPVLCRMMELYLDEGHRVATFASAEEVLTAIGQRLPDLLISDITMPDMDGIELRRSLSRASSTELIPFVFLTSRKDAETRRTALSLGIDDYLVKPPRKADVIAVCERVLTRARQLRERLGVHIEHQATALLAPDLPPLVRGFATAVRSRQPEAGGGDLVCYFPGETGDTLILADVMGHGIDAKFFAHAHAGYLYGLARSLPASLSPARILSELSALVAGDPLLESAPITCLVVRIADGGQITIASAGHPRPILWSRGKLNFVDVGGILPGLDPEIQYLETDLSLALGDRLFLYTDGLIDPTERSGGAWLRGTVLREIEGTADHSVESVADRIMACHGAYWGDAPRDDSTLVALDFVGQK